MVEGKKFGGRMTLVITLVIALAAAGLIALPAAGARPAPPKVGEVIEFGEWNWRVLDVKDGRALIITENIIEKRPYNAQYREVTWETSSLREYLNGEFLKKFTAEEQERIVETRIQNPDNLWNGTSGGNDTIDKVFLLSLEEVDRYFGNSGDYDNEIRKEYEDEYPVGKLIPADDGWFFSNKNDSARIAKYDNEAWCWWLRSPGDYGNYAASVGDDGSVGVYGFYVTYDHGSVRPALWLNL